GVITMMVEKGSLAVPISAAKPDQFGALKDRAPNRALSSELLSQAERMIELGLMEPAIVLFESALLWDAGNADLYSKIGQIHLLKRQFPSAAAYLLRSIQMQPWPDKPDPYLSLGSAFLGMEKAEESITIWSEALQKYPLDNSFLWSRLAIVFLKGGHNLDAAVYARIALKTFSDEADQMNEVYKRARNKMSNSDLEKLRAIEGDIDGHLNGLRAAADRARKDGKAFMSGEAERVITSFAGVQQEVLNPNLGRLEIGKRPQPLKISDEELAGRFIRGRIDVAKEHLRAGRRDQAIEILQDVIKSYPKNSETESARLALRIIQK